MLYKNKYSMGTKINNELNLKLTQSKYKGLSLSSKFAHSKLDRRSIISILNSPAAK